jgi:hypothetical protein
MQQEGAVEQARGILSHAKSVNAALQLQLSTMCVWSCTGRLFLCLSWGLIVDMSENVAVTLVSQS